MIITESHLVDPFVKRILTGLFNQYSEHVSNGDWEGQISFDEYVWIRLQELGQATYEAIGEQYGDLDEAINEVSDDTI